MITSRTVECLNRLRIRYVAGIPLATGDLEGAGVSPDEAGAREALGVLFFHYRKPIVIEQGGYYGPIFNMTAVA